MTELTEADLLLKWNQLVQAWHEDELQPFTLDPRTAHDEGLSCACVYQHRPPPLELHFHHILPVYLGGRDEASNKIILCPTTHANVHEIMRVLIKDRMLTYAEVDALNERTVSHYAYDLAVDGFNRWKTTQGI